METSIFAGAISGTRAWATRFGVSSVLGMILWAQPASSAVSISPSPSTNGSYTVSWSTPIGCNLYYDDFGTPWDICYYLQETGPTSGVWSSGGTSMNFSGKPAGTYTYSILAHYVSYLWGIDQWYTIEGPASVNVCTTHTVPYYSGWAQGLYQYPYFGSCTFYYEGILQYPTAWDGLWWCDATFPLPQTGTIQICN